MSDNYSKLKEKAIKAGIDIDLIVFSVNVADIIYEISAIHYSDDISVEKLIELISIGKDGADRIEWNMPIYEAINNEAISIYEETEE